MDEFKIVYLFAVTAHGIDLPRSPGKLNLPYPEWGYPVFMIALGAVLLCAILRINVLELIVDLFADPGNRQAEERARRHENLCIVYNFLASHKNTLPPRDRTSFEKYEGPQIHTAWAKIMKYLSRGKREKIDDCMKALMENEPSQNFLPPGLEACIQILANEIKKNKPRG